MENGEEEIGARPVVHPSTRPAAAPTPGLARFFGTDARNWMNLQAEFDLEVGACALGDRIQREVTPWSAAA